MLTNADNGCINSLKIYSSDRTWVIYMSENVLIKKGGEIGGKPGAHGRQRSTIGFPYVTMPDAEKLAQAIHSRVGHGSCEEGQLAAWSNQSVKSSTFRIQIAAARLFGIIEAEGSNSFRLTTLGRQMMDPASARSAKVEAFLNVPLFKALYESHKDGVLPPAAALEREIADLGVSTKQKDRARQVFERSAENAGFFESGKNRLVKPAVTGKPDIPPPPPAQKSHGNGGGSGDSPNLDPLLTALLLKIPHAGEAWDAEKRLRWFKTFAMNVSQIYDNEGDPVEFEIRLAKGFSTPPE